MPGHETEITTGEKREPWSCWVVPQMRYGAKRVQPPRQSRRGIDPELEQTAISGLRAQVVSIASLIVFSLLSPLIAVTLDWHGVRRLPKAVRVGAN